MHEERESLWLVLSVQKKGKKFKEGLLSGKSVRRVSGLGLTLLRIPATVQAMLEEDATPGRYLEWTVASLYSLLILVSSFFVFGRRNRPGLRRSPLLFLIIKTSCPLVLFFLVSFGEWIFPCGMRQWIHSFNYTVFGNFWALFAFKLYYLQRSTLAKIHKNYSSWFLRHNQLISSKFVALTVFLPSVILVGIITGIQLSFAADGMLSLSLEDPNSCYKGEAFIAVTMQYLIIGICYVICGSILVVLFRQNKEITDGLGMKRDLRFSVIIWLVAIVLWVILAFIPNDYIPSSIIPCTAMVLQYFFCTFLHLKEKGDSFLISVEERRLSESSGEDSPRQVPMQQQKNQISFEQVLKDPALLEEFRKYLTSIYAIENLLFIESIAEWKKLRQEKSTVADEAALKIFDTYFEGKRSNGSERVWAYQSSCAESICLETGTIPGEHL
jgi:hypothetical protein